MVSRSMADSQVPCPADGFSVQQPVVDRTRLGLQLGRIYLLSAWRETDLYTALALIEALTSCCLMVCI
jgi:hypothetical protein